MTALRLVARAEPVREAAGWTLELLSPRPQPFKVVADPDAPAAALHLVDADGRPVAKLVLSVREAGRLVDALVHGPGRERAGTERNE